MQTHFINLPRGLGVARAAGKEHAIEKRSNGRLFPGRTLHDVGIAEQTDFLTRALQSLEKPDRFRGYLDQRLRKLLDPIFRPVLDDMVWNGRVNRLGQTLDNSQRISFFPSEPVRRLFKQVRVLHFFRNTQQLICPPRRVDAREGVKEVEDEGFCISDYDWKSDLVHRWKKL